MSDNIERYRKQYTLRPETFEASVDVSPRVSQARLLFSGWVSFSQAASGEPNWQKQLPEKVEVATEIM